MIRILIVGPDGTGKSTTANALADELARRGFEVRARHGAPSARRSTDKPPEEQPHLKQARSLPASVLKVALSFVRYAGDSYRPASGSPQIDIVERGWDDQIVDPVRYRLHAGSVALARRLGGFLPKSDLCVLLAGDASLVHARKAEIPVEEIDRQIEAWRRISPQHNRTTLEMDCVGERPEAIATAAADRAVALFGAGDRWRALWPSPSRIDLRVVSGPHAIEASSFYTPMTRRAQEANRVARVAFRSRLRRKSTPPVPELRSILSVCGLGGLAVATMESSADGRHIVGVADTAGLVAVLKIGRADDAGLENEARFLELLAPTGLVPKVLATGRYEDRFFTATRAVAPVTPAVDCSVEQAADLATKLQLLEGFEPMIHGDLAPWNVVATKSGLILLDWEHAAIASKPMYDLAHFVVQSGALLDRWRPEAAVKLLTAAGSPGAGHLEALGGRVEDAPALVREYLAAAPAASEDRVRTFRAELAALLAR